MSRTGDVIKNKNKVEKSRKIRRKNEMLNLRNRSAFKAKLPGNVALFPCLKDFAKLCFVALNTLLTICSDKPDNATISSYLS